MANYKVVDAAYAAANPIEQPRGIARMSAALSINAKLRNAGRSGIIPRPHEPNPFEERAPDRWIQPKRPVVSPSSVFMPENEPIVPTPPKTTPDQPTMFLEDDTVGSW